MSKLIYSASLVALCLSTQNAFAQSPATVQDSTSTYQLSDFKQFSPRTAMDLIANIPGFNIVEADSKRGLGQAGGNVLINGKRISTKSNDLSDILSQIPAANVVQIIVQDASQFNIPGLSGIVANIETQASGFKTQWEWNPVFRNHRSPWLGAAKLTMTGQSGPFNFNISLENEVRRNNARGPETLRDRNSSIFETRDEYFHYNEDAPSISTYIGYENSAGSIGSLNINYEKEDWSFTEWSKRKPNNNSPYLHIFTESEQEWGAEINADYEFALAGGRMKLIGLHSVEDSPYYNQVHIATSDTEFENGRAYTNHAKEAESIIRGEYSWMVDNVKEWQISAETAFNSLESDSLEYVQATDSLAFNALADTASFDEVKEKRAELNITHGRPLTDQLKLQTSLGGEFSQITQTGSGQAEREFFRPKGFLNLSYVPQSDLTLSARLDRQVGQLDFGDFIASRDISEGNDNATNTDIVPEQSWKLSLEMTKQHGPYGSVSFSVFGEEVEDIVEQVPLDATNEAPGNLDSAQRFGAEISGTFNFAPLGIQGLKLDYQANANDSRLKDPLTGKTRRIGGQTMSYVELDLRYDIPNTNWAVSGYYERVRWAFDPRLNLNLRQYNDIPFTALTIEHKDFFGMQASLGVRNLSNQEESLFKEVYVDRRDGPVARTEYRIRRYEPYVIFSLKGEF
ncbi:TonB-dependent receptor plug domain-containing protein [Hirschia litorea]|uniref:TonB-dependent receptor plug domain-containing protein n=1 Tax=Hirschia litorea TaxID=1199156 RepID=A0ABW2IM35_9PROT